MLVKTNESKEILKVIFRSLLSKQTKTVVTGSTFRVTKETCEKALALIERIGLPAICHRSTDQWSLKYKDSEVIFLPVGDGTKVAGRRPHCIVIINSEEMDQSIVDFIETVFRRVNSNPVFETIEKLINEE